MHHQQKHHQTTSNTHSETHHQKNSPQLKNKPNEQWAHCVTQAMYWYCYPDDVCLMMFFIAVFGWCFCWCLFDWVFEVYWSLQNKINKGVKIHKERCQATIIKNSEKHEQQLRMINDNISRKSSNNIIQNTSEA